MGGDLAEEVALGEAVGRAAAVAPGEDREAFGRKRLGPEDRVVGQGGRGLVVGGVGAGPPTAASAGVAPNAMITDVTGTKAAASPA